MKKKHASGSLLAISGAALTVVAVIAGLIMVGGPGYARAERLDQMTYASLSRAADAAQCAFLISGESADSLDEIRRLSERFGAEVPYSVCTERSHAHPRQATDELDERVEYRRLDGAGVEFCATFLRPIGTWINELAPYDRPSFSELLTPHTTGGRHCYQIDLAKLIFSRDLAHIADTARVARCAYFINGDVQPSIEAAVDALNAHPDLRMRANCDWIEMYDYEADDSLTYERLAANRVRLCATFDAKRHREPESALVTVTADPDFTFDSLNDAILSAGRRCFEIDVDSASDLNWGHPVR